MHNHRLPPVQLLTDTDVEMEHAMRMHTYVYRVGYWDERDAAESAAERLQSQCDAVTKTKLALERDPSENDVSDWQIDVTFGYTNVRKHENWNVIVDDELEYDDMGPTGAYHLYVVNQNWELHATERDSGWGVTMVNRDNHKTTREATAETEEIAVETLYIWAYTVGVNDG